MSAGEYVFLCLLIAGGVMYLGDAVNSCTAAVREVIEVLRKDKP